MVVGGKRYAPAGLRPGRDPVPIAQEAGWAPGPIWTGAENIVSTEILSPHRLAHRSSIIVQPIASSYTVYNILDHNTETKSNRMSYGAGEGTKACPAIRSS